jgi:hypothetical protein
MPALHTSSFTCQHFTPAPSYAFYAFTGFYADLEERLANRAGVNAVRICERCERTCESTHCVSRRLPALMLVTASAALASLAHATSLPTESQPSARPGARAASLAARRLAADGTQEQGDQDLAAGHDRVSPAQSVKV